MSAREKKPRRLRKLIVLAAIGGLIVLAIMYATCGHGFGIGGGGGVGTGSETGTGKGTGKGTESAPVADAMVARCEVRVDASGISVDGKKVTEDAAVAACKQAGAADVLVTGDAVQGTWDHLRAALTTAGVATFVRADASSVDAAP